MYLEQVDKLCCMQEVLARLLAEPGEEEVDEGEDDCVVSMEVLGDLDESGTGFAGGKGMGTGMTSPYQIVGWMWTYVLTPLRNTIQICQICPLLQKYNALAQMQRPTSFTSNGRPSFPTSCPHSFPLSQLPMDKRLFYWMGFVPCVSKQMYAL